MPRFCLFGDSVVMAARLETTGIVNKIHCSQIFVDSLAKELNTDVTIEKCINDDSKVFVVDKYNFTKRDNVNLKGIGEVDTYLI